MTLSRRVKLQLHQIVEVALHPEKEAPQKFTVYLGIHVG
jgi:hypothetical protein